MTSERVAKLTILSAIIAALAMGVSAVGQAQPSGAGVGSGGAASVEALRDILTAAVRTHQSAALEPLFLCGQPEQVKSWRKEMAEVVGKPVASVEIGDAQKTVGDYSRYHAHFSTPPVKVLTITFKQDKDGSEDLFVGLIRGRYYIVSSVRDGS